MIPVYVPSKGRAGRSKTLALLSEEAPDRPVRLCVPVAEVDTYRILYAPSASVIGQSGKGIGSARQTILEDARASGHRLFWMLDDDTTATFERRGGTRFRRIPLGEALDRVESLVSDEMGHWQIGMTGLQFRHRAWSGEDIEYDQPLRNFVLVNTAAPFDYWPHVKEDLDAVLQILTRGWHTIRLNAYAFDSPTMGTLEGGCADDYAAGALEEASRLLTERWPGIVGLRIGKRGYVESPVNWKAVRGRTIQRVATSQ